MIELILKKVKYLAKSLLCMGVLLLISTFSTFVFAGYSFYRLTKLKKQEYLNSDDDEEEALAIFSNGNV